MTSSGPEKSLSGNLLVFSLKINWWKFASSEPFIGHLVFAVGKLWPKTDN